MATIQFEFDPKYNVWQPYSWIGAKPLKKKSRD